MRPEDREVFACDGFAMRHNFLPSAVSARLHESLVAWQGAYRDMQQGGTVTRRFALDPVLFDTIPDPHALSLHPEWQALIRYVSSFNVEPVFYVQAIVARRGDEDRTAKTNRQFRLYTDAFQPSAKAWLLLDDVPKDGGR